MKFRNQNLEPRRPKKKHQEFPEDVRTTCWSTFDDWHWHPTPVTTDLYTIPHVYTLPCGFCNARGVPFKGKPQSAVICTIETVYPVFLSGLHWMDVHGLKLKLQQRANSGDEHMPDHPNLTKNGLMLLTCEVCNILQCSCCEFCFRSLRCQGWTGKSVCQLGCLPLSPIHMAT